MRNADCIMNKKKVMQEKKPYMDSIITGLKEIIKYDVAAGIEKPYNDYIDWAHKIVMREYLHSRKGNSTKSLTIDDKTEIIRIWNEIKSDVLSQIETIIHDVKHRRLTKEIRATTAKAVIKAAMKAAGLKHNFVGQTYRAKVSVMITHNRMLTVYISYKTLNESLPHVIESIKKIRSELESLGSNISINKSYYIEDWED